jgi:hypothetical protein
VPRGIRQKSAVHFGGVARLMPSADIVVMTTESRGFPFGGKWINCWQICS